MAAAFDATAQSIGKAGSMPSSWPAGGHLLADDPVETNHAPVSLVDMPSAWLPQFAAALGEDERVPLFKTCGVLRDLVLSQHPVRLQYDLLQGHAEAAQASLALACKLSPSIKLVLHGNVKKPVDLSATARKLITAARAVPGHGAKAIKRVELRGLILDGLMPSWLLDCPNVTSVQLHSCKFSRPSLQLCEAPRPASHVPCGQLNELHLGCAPGIRTKMRYTYRLSDQWQDELRALTGLQSLTLSNDQNNVGCEDWLKCCSAIGRQLTQLIIMTEAASSDKLPMQLPAWFLFVTSLGMHQATVDDKGMKVLLRMRHVKHLAVNGFQLQHSHAAQPCSWTQLSFKSIHIKSFTRLPLGGVQSLHAIPPLPDPMPWDPGFTIHPCADLAVSQQAVTAVLACGGVQWGALEAVCISFKAIPGLRAVDALLPILSTCKATALCLRGVKPLTPRLLADMHSFITRLPPTVTTIQLEHSSITSEVLPLLLPQLPAHCHSLKLFNICVIEQAAQSVSLKEAHLTDICVHASRPVTVGVECGLVQCDGRRWPEGWEQRVQAAMMAATGQQHVTLADVSHHIMYYLTIEEAFSRLAAQRPPADNPPTAAVVVGAPQDPTQLPTPLAASNPFSPTPAVGPSFANSSTTQLHPAAVAASAATTAAASSPAAAPATAAPVAGAPAPAAPAAAAAAAAAAAPAKPTITQMAKKVWPGRSGLNPLYRELVIMLGQPRNWRKANVAKVLKVLRGKACTRKWAQYQAPEASSGWSKVPTLVQGVRCLTLDADLLRLRVVELRQMYQEAISAQQ